MRGFLIDFRQALRQLRRAPGFVTIAVATLALTIGATTAVFTVVDGVLLQALPYPDSERLIRVWHENVRTEDPRETVSHETFRELVDQVPSVDAAAGISPRWSFALRGDEAPERIQGYWVSASFFELLGARPIHGRGILAEEDRTGASPVAVLSHALWQRRFGGDPGVVGSTITLDSGPVTVVGVMPAGFRFGEPADVWLPLALNPIADNGRQVRWVDVVARLAPGRAAADARPEIAAFMRRLEELHPDANAGLRATVEDLHTAVVGDVRPALWTLLAGVGLVLLIGCANVSNLLLTRLAVRRDEFATRRALGAARGRVVRQTFVEALTLTLLGALGGTMLAFWFIEALRWVGPADLPRLQEVAMDLRALGAATGLALAAAVVVGLSPALTAAKAGARPLLGSGARDVKAAGGRLRRALVVSQLALALVLVVGGGLLLRSFVELMRTDPGFRTQGVLTLQMGLPDDVESDRTVLYEELFEEIGALPGVEAVGGVTRLPLGDAVSTRLQIEGRAVAEGDQPEVQFRRAGGDYFQAMGIPILRGRGFDERDRPDERPVILVNRTAAERLWPDGDPVGHQVRFWFAGITPDAPWLEVVGVTGDVRHFGLDAEPPPVVYVPFSQGPPGSPLIAVRTEGDPGSLARPVRDRIQALAPEAVVWDVATMESRVSESVAGRRFSLLLVGAFGILALLLAAVGIYGVVAFGVRTRTREIGIRMALGATEGEVVRAAVAEGLRLAGVGLAAGLAVAVVGTRLMEGLLFHVAPTDPITLVGVTLLFALVVFVASWLPARHAARIHPMEALRHE